MDIASQALNWVFIGSLIIQLLYWILVFRKLGAVDVGTSSPQYDSRDVCLLVAFKNEEANLILQAPKLIEQDYSNYEVRYVNDFSTDGSVSVLEAYERELTVQHAKIDKAGKKTALGEGIQTTDKAYVLVTDADGIPASNNWMQHMMSRVSRDTNIILGYAPYFKRSGWLNKFIRYETVMTAVQYLSYTLIGKPYMGVGRNMLYERDLYLRVEDQIKGKNIASGDDDLFINVAATAENTDICIHPESFIYSEPKSDWASYYQQKKRHLSTAQYYKRSDKFWLSLYGGTKLASVISAIVLILFGKFLMVILGMLGFYVVTMMIFYSITRILKEEDLFFYYIPLDLGITLYYLLMAPFTLQGSQKWK